MRGAARMVGMAMAGCLWMMTGCGAVVSQDLQTTAKDFSLKDLNGGTVTLEGLLGQNKAALLNFTATWCPYCKDEIPELIELQNTYQPRGFTVLGVDVGESQAKVAGFAQKMRINYPVLLDTDSAVAESYGVVGIPTSYLVDRQGKVIGQYHRITKELVRKIEEAVQ